MIDPCNAISMRTYTEREQSQLEEEYKTLCCNVNEILFNKPESHSHVQQTEKVWYQIGTNSKIYSKCKNIIHFAIPYLTRSFNECIVEFHFSLITVLMNLLDHSNIKLLLISAMCVEMGHILYMQIISLKCHWTNISEKTGIF